MGPGCTICAHPDRADIDSRLLAGQSGHRIAQELNLSVASLYRHSRGRHHKEQQRAQIAAGAPIAPSPDSAVVAQVSKSLRAAEGLMRLAWKHLKATSVGQDPKATNGAITATNKTLELIAQLRGEMQRGAPVNVTVTAEARTAIDLRGAAQGLSAHETTEHARTWLAAQLEAGDRDAMRTVMELVRMIPEAEVVKSPVAAQEVTPTPSSDVIA